VFPPADFNRCLVRLNSVVSRFERREIGHPRFLWWVMGHRVFTEIPSPNVAFYPRSLSEFGFIVARSAARACICLPILLRLIVNWIIRLTMLPMTQ
jgi:hypothetical protein